MPLYRRILHSVTRCMFHKEQRLSVELRACQRTGLELEAEFGELVNNRSDLHCFATLLPAREGKIHTLRVHRHRNLGMVRSLVATASVV
jgi:hypothetical protein